MDDPFATLLSKARVKLGDEDGAGYESGVGFLGMPSQWREVVRLLEALSAAAKVSRMLHNDCVKVPSLDESHMYNAETLHGLLMQQLLMLETGLAAGRQRSSAVPTRVQPILSPEYVIPTPTQRERLEAAAAVHDNDEQQEEGGTCIIT